MSFLGASGLPFVAGFSCCGHALGLALLACAAVIVGTSADDSNVMARIVDSASSKVVGAERRPSMHSSLSVSCFYFLWRGRLDLFKA